MKRTITIVLGALALGGLMAMPQIGRAQMGNDQQMTKVRKGHHPEIHRAINHLEKTKEILESSADDFGGHKRNAENLIDQAIAQLQQGDQVANQNH